jgi:hypothetical protein
MRNRRWQAAPNDRQLEALVTFERTWDERPARRATAEPARAPR